MLSVTKATNEKKRRIWRRFNRKRKKWKLFNESNVWPIFHSNFWCLKFYGLEVIIQSLNFDFMDGLKRI